MPRDPLLILRVPPSLKARIAKDAETRGTTTSEAVRGILLAAYPTPTRAPRQPTQTPERVPEAQKPSGKRRIESLCEHRVTTGSYCRRCARVV